MSTHLAEMLLDLKLHGKPDGFRQTHPFSEDIEATHAILFNPRYDKWKKLRAYRKWVASGQPCLVGKAAAKMNSVFVCILEEHEILRMNRGDDDLRETIQDHRQAWKRYALEGSFSSFMVLLLSKSLVDRSPATNSRRSVGDFLSYIWKSIELTMIRSCRNASMCSCVRQRVGS